MVKKDILFAEVGIGVLLLDMLTKYLIATFKPSFVLPFFSLTYIENTGMILGLLSGYQALFILFTFIVLGAVYYYYSKIPNDPWVISGMALITGGAVGNLLDRIIRGHIVDFLDFFIGRFHWPAFNVADAAIVIGVAFLIWKWK